MRLNRSAGRHAAQDQPNLQTRGEWQEPDDQQRQEGYEDKVGSKGQEDQPCVPYWGDDLGDSHAEAHPHHAGDDEDECAERAYGD